MARKGNPISVRLDLNRSSDSSRFSEGDRESRRMGQSFPEVCPRFAITKVSSTFLLQLTFFLLDFYFYFICFYMFLSSAGAIFGSFHFGLFMAGPPIPDLNLPPEPEGMVPHGPPPIDLNCPPLEPGPSSAPVEHFQNDPLQQKLKETLISLKMQRVYLKFWERELVRSELENQLRRTGFSHKLSRTLAEEILKKLKYE